jgi:hypothetical protein
MVRTVVLLCATLASAALVPFAGGGCGSSSTGSLSGGSSGGGSGSGGSSGSGSSSGASSSDGGGEAGPSCVAPGSVPASDVPPYATVVQSLNACTSAEIAAFIAACDSSTYSAAACDAWQTDPGNATCDACLLPVTDAGASTYSGAVLVNAAGNTFIGGNSAGCIALADTSAGPACAADLEPLLQCHAFGCGNCDVQASYDDCITSLNTGACMEYASPVESSCAMDLADGGAFGADCSNETAIINVICGTGM